MWSGSLRFGDCWVAYIGSTDQNSVHAHVATQLAVGLDGDVGVAWSGGIAKGKGVLIAPRVKHTAQTSAGRVIFFYLEPQSLLSTVLLSRFGTGVVMTLDADIVGCIASAPDLESAYRALSTLFDVAPPRIDLRLEAALDSLRHDRGGVGAIARAAQIAALSEPRLRALAQDLLGVPLSQWLLWRKLERAAQAIAKGSSLADAAAEGNFADQAHLSRTMRRMFGIATGDAVDSLRKNKRFIQDIE